MTPQFMSSPRAPRARSFYPFGCAPRASRGVVDREGEVLDDAVGEETLAHLADARLRALAADVGEVEIDDLPDPHVGDLRIAEAVQRVLDRLALRIENALLRR